MAVKIGQEVDTWLDLSLSLRMPLRAARMVQARLSKVVTLNVVKGLIY